MAIDTKSFSLQIKTGLVEIKEQAQEVLADTAFEILQNTVMATPVDDGALRSNWRMAADATDTDYDESHVKNEGLSAATTLVAELKEDGKEFEYITISNNLPYAKTVEYGLYPDPPKVDTGKTVGGYSKLAPKGMFRTSLLKFHSIARKHAKEKMGKK